MCFKNESEGQDLNDKNIEIIQNEITELLIPELPVLRAKTRISQEKIAKKNRYF